MTDPKPWPPPPGSSPSFQDIPEYIRPSDGGLTLEWGHVEEWIAQESSGGRSFVMEPDFQRGHVWSRAQQSAYVEFCLKGGVGSRTILFNHPGYQSPPRPHCDLDPEAIVCVDGLQRLTAVRRFMADELPAFNHLRSEWRGSLRLRQARLEVHVQNLQTRAELLRWYLELNSGGVAHSKQEIERVRKMLAVEQRASEKARKRKESK